LRKFEKTGFEAFIAVDGEAMAVKKLMCQIEQADALGRLFDIDVLQPDGSKIERTLFHHEPRQCLICGEPAVICGSQRAHTVAELQKKTNEILNDFFHKQYANRIAANAVQSLLYEVSVTPKPGLVDRADNGSHKDMDFYSFLRSVSCLEAYFRDMVLCGIQHAQAPAAQTTELLQFIGKRAELSMLEKTGGVNTHKGAIFSMGILCGALGRLYNEELTSEKIISVCRNLSEPIMTAFIGKPITNAQTSGEKFFQAYGITGIRGEVAQGFPSVFQIGLPQLCQLLKEGYSEDDAGGIVLLHLMANVDDTNMIARSDYERQQRSRRELQELLSVSPRPDKNTRNLLNQRFVEENLSPGGCADMLAICWMLLFTEMNI
jgi:Triphosphoribosyl-dephospho-CoA synthetase